MEAYLYSLCVLLCVCVCMCVCMNVRVCVTLQGVWALEGEQPGSGEAGEQWPGAALGPRVPPHHQAAGQAAQPRRHHRCHHQEVRDPLPAVRHPGR